MGRSYLLDCCARTFPLVSKYFLLWEHWRKAHQAQGLAHCLVQQGHGGTQHQAPLHGAGKSVDRGDVFLLQIFFSEPVGLQGCLRVGRVGPADIPLCAQGRG